MDTGSEHPESARYQNPPIVEAVVSISFVPLQAEQLSRIQAFAARHLAEYPQQTKRFQQEAKLQFGSMFGYQSSQIEDGVVCVSGDRQRIVQFALGSVTFNRLAPYKTWDHFEAQIKPLWSMFENEFGPNITELQVRYINRIEIPIGEPMESYIRTYPEISSELPQNIGRYFMRVDIPMDDSLLIMQQGLVESPSPGFYAILLDNDLRYVLPTGDLWGSMRKARETKNRIFQACITDKLAERLN